MGNEPAVSAVSWGTNAVKAIGPAAVVAALGYFFGWKRTEAVYTYLGFDPSLLRFSPQDYLLRSVEALWLLMTVLVGVAIVIVAIHWIVTARYSFEPALRTGALVLICLAVLSSIPVGLGLYDVKLHHDELVPPVALCLSALSSGYAVFLLSVAPAGGATGNPKLSSAVSRLLMALIVSLGVLGLFWLTSNWAAIDGENAGNRLEYGLKTMPEVILFSRTNLGLESAGAAVGTLPSDKAGGSYRYRYGHLRLVIESGGRLFLLPDSWKHGQGSAIIVADDSNIQIEIHEHT